MARHLLRSEASSSKRIQSISLSPSVLLTLFTYVLWLPRFESPVARRPYSDALG